MRISLERDAGRERPVYKQIAEHIRREVDAGRLRGGERLPPIRELARKLGVNRDTAALAYESLASDGIVESGVGRGTFVASTSRPASDDLPPPALSPSIDRLLRFERARPRFGSATGAVPMHGLIPDPSLYPVDEFRRVLNRVLSESGADLLLYGDPQGYRPLREAIAGRLRSASAEVDADDIVVCHGASQGITLALRLFAGPGDRVALEEPTYNNALAAVMGLGLESVPVPMRESGLDLAVLDRTLARPDVKLLYTMPTHHNPMGTTASLSHRRALLEIAARHRKPVVEDGYEMDLRFAGRAVPPLLALDPDGLVIHLVSFSKSLFPGARVGAIAARARVVEALLALKQATDLSDSMPLQAAVALLVTSGAYDRHLVRLRRVLRERCRVVHEVLEREMPEGVHWTRPDGGYQVWVELPEGVDTGDLLADAVGAGVLFAPGAQFHHDGRPSCCLRLSLAMADAADLERGVTALARVVRERLSQSTNGRMSARVSI